MATPETRGSRPALRIATAIVSIAAPLAALCFGCAQILGLEDPRDPPGDGGGGVGDDAGGDGSTSITGDGSPLSDAPPSSDAPDFADVGNEPAACSIGLRCGGPLGNKLEECEAGSNKFDAALIECPSYCIAGFCTTPRGCQDDAGAPLPPSCGPSGTESCCAGTRIPGGSFVRSYDGVTAKDPTYKAEVSSFVLDRFEVTVGRFRRFVDQYGGQKPDAGDGRNLHDPLDPGWNSAWPLPANATALRQALGACAGGGTWTDTPGVKEHLPVTCVDWFTAFAFCIWEGGRLPTEAEWNFAAAGGGDTEGQRVYPWSVPPSSQTFGPSYANNVQFADVGSRSPTGDGRWGQSDLAGNAAEWVLDWYVTPYASTTCTNCAQTTEGKIENRVVRGGTLAGTATQLTASARDRLVPSEPIGYSGFRCARPFK